MSSTSIDQDQREIAGWAQAILSAHLQRNTSAARSVRLLDDVVAKQDAGSAGTVSRDRGTFE